MSRATRPLQYVDSNFVTLNHMRSDDSAWVIYDSNNNPIYCAYARAGKSLAESAWQLRQIQYSGNNPIRILFPIPTGGAEASNDYQFIVDQGTTYTITGITQANPGVVTVSSITGLAAGQYVYIASVAGMTQVNNTVFRVGTIVGSTFQLLTTAGANVNTTSYTAYSSGGTAYKYNAINYTYA